MSKEKDEGGGKDERLMRKESHIKKTKGSTTRTRSGRKGGVKREHREGQGQKEGKSVLQMEEKVIKYECSQKEEGEQEDGKERHMEL